MLLVAEIIVLQTRQRWGRWAQVPLLDHTYLRNHCKSRRKALYVLRPTSPAFAYATNAKFRRDLGWAGNLSPHHIWYVWISSFFLPLISPSTILEYLVCFSATGSMVGKLWSSLSMNLNDGCIMCLCVPLSVLINPHAITFRKKKWKKMAPNTIPGNSKTKKYIRGAQTLHSKIRKFRNASDGYRLWTSLCLYFDDDHSYLKKRKCCFFHIKPFFLHHISSTPSVLPDYSSSTDTNSVVTDRETEKNQTSLKNQGRQIKC